MSFYPCPLHLELAAFVMRVHDRTPDSELDGQQLAQGVDAAARPARQEAAQPEEVGAPHGAGAVKGIAGIARQLPHTQRLIAIS